jgi:hypothetical protein
VAGARSLRSGPKFAGIDRATRADPRIGQDTALAGAEVPDHMATRLTELPGVCT